MTSSRFSLLALGVALIDYVLVVVLAVMGTAWWQVARFVYGPQHYTHDLLGTPGLMIVVTLVAMRVFWSVAGRLSFLQARSRNRRVAMIERLRAASAL